MKVLITGAGGFIGGRATEVFHDSGRATVRAGIRRWSTAARIGRLPVEIVQCDVMSPDQVRSAVEGADAVVHCAVGGPAVTVQGTRNVLQASLDAGIPRVVHISTIDVYGDGPGELDEAVACRRTGAEYGDSKIAAEEVCWSFLDQGLKVAVLRPTIVYGPFSTLWTEEFAERLQVRPWPFPASLCLGTCNLVYVDDVVAAMGLALTEPGAVGEAFNVNGPDRPTWQEYFLALNSAMGLPPIEARPVASSTISAWAFKPLRSVARFGLRNFGDQIMGLYQRSDVAKRIMKATEARLRKAPTTGEFKLYNRRASFPIDKAREKLGYAPAVDMSRGVDLSVRWLRHSGFILDEGEDNAR